MEVFEITYRIFVLDGEEIDTKIEAICLEQSVELPLRALSKDIKTKIVGRLSSQKQVGENIYAATISWPVENIGGEISNFLNILYGNISLQAGIRIIDAKWPVLNGPLFRGPALGIEELRSRFGINARPLSGTSLKPVGSTSEEIGELCYQFAAGGIDIIKDDHGLANQSYAPFEERVRACVSGIKKAAEETGRRSYYFSHITALAEQAVQRYVFAAENGADGVLICPHIAGMETMHQLARMDLSLPIIAHPAFSGGLTTHDIQGLAPDFLYGQLWRALGADFIVYPNTGGRFSFSPQECAAINDSARSVELPFKKSFPMPGGGMQLNNMKKWIETYGPDTVFLIGGSLYEHPEGVRKAAETFRSLLI